jgi:hypothetical protein
MDCDTNVRMFFNFKNYFYISLFKLLAQSKMAESFTAIGGMVFKSKTSKEFDNFVEALDKFIEVELIEMGVDKKEIEFSGYRIKIEKIDS